MQIQKILLGLAIIIAISGITMAFKQYREAKKYSVTLSIEQWTKTVGGMEEAVQLLKQSNMPANQVLYITDSLLLPSKYLIVEQINATLAAEKKAADSIAKPKK